MRICNYVIEPDLIAWLYNNGEGTNETLSAPIGEPGHYDASFSFQYDTDGAKGTEVSWITSQYNTTSDCYATIIDEYNEHKKVLDVVDGPSLSSYVSAYNLFTQPRQSDSIEFWAASSTSSKTSEIILDGEGGNLALQFYYDGRITYYDGTSYNTILSSYNPNELYHFMIDYDVNSDWHIEIRDHNLTILASDYGAGYAFNGTPTMIDKMKIQTSDLYENYHLYIDAIGMVSDPSYTLGDNREQMDVELFDVITEQYRVIDLTTGEEGEWTIFNSQLVDQLCDLGDLPEFFTLEYRVIDSSGNIGSVSSCDIIYQKETEVVLTDNSIDLNSDQLTEREIVIQNNGQFGDANKLDAYINNMYYGTATLDESDNYILSFGKQNTLEGLSVYSESLLSDNIYGNINPLAHVAWETRKDDFYGFTKHVLVDGDIMITNPLTDNATSAMDITQSYEYGYKLSDFVRMKRVYYINGTSPLNETNKIDLNYGTDYMVDMNGFVSFPEGSSVHALMQNITLVRDNLIYFNYASSEFSEQLNQGNAEGICINFLMPSVYYDHTTIEKLVIYLNDFKGNSFAKVLYDIDLKKYFLPDVKTQYEKTVFGMGKMMAIPLYISFAELSMSNPNQFFDLRMLESISLKVQDSSRWPGSFVKEYGDYSVLDLPYQRIGVENIRLYNFISDSQQEDENGFITSTLEIRVPRYHEYKATTEMKIKRANIPLSDFKLYYEGDELTSQIDIEYGDFIDVFFKYGGTNEAFLLDEIFTVPLAIANASSGEAYSYATMQYISKYDMLAPNGYRDGYYYARFKVPDMLGETELKFTTQGTPLMNFTFSGASTFTLNITQESLNTEEPIYLEDSSYKVKYGENLIIEGALLDNDQYWVEDEVYTYSYQEALDGETVHPLSIAASYGDPEFISRDEFTIYYVNEFLEILPLYVNSSTTNYRHPMLLNNPQINYVNNTFVVNIDWDTQDVEFLEYDTNLLISYKVLKGRSIQPVSFSSVDQYGHSKKDNLREIPFAEYDMISQDWITEKNFTQRSTLTKQTLVKKVEQSSITISSPRYLEGTHITLGITSLDNVYVNWSDSEEFDVLDESEYSWSIDSSGQLVVNELPYSTGVEFKIIYSSYLPIDVEHPLTAPSSTIKSIKITSEGNYSQVYEFTPSEYELSDDGYNIYFTDIYNSILKTGDFDMFDPIEISYHAPLTRKIDLSTNLILSLQDSVGNYIPIDTIGIDGLGFFEYSRMFSLQDLQLPVGGERISNLKLAYLPIHVYDKSQEQFMDISYEYESSPGVFEKSYNYKESASYEKYFRVETEQKKVKLRLMEDRTEQNMLISQKTFNERKYHLNYNPLETLEEGEEYTSLQIDAQVREDYEFTFQLSELEDDSKTINNSVVWLHVGFMPKSESKFLNTRATIEGTSTHPYFESLGTEELTSVGPGYGEINKMFGRPIVYQTADTENNYGPYIWTYGITDEAGQVTFDISLNEEYLNDFAKIFGSIEGIESIKDTVLYIRAFTTYFNNWDEYALTNVNSNNTICCKEESIFNGTSIPNNYDLTSLIPQDDTYAEGIIRLHKGDISLGAGDYYSYELPDNITDSNLKPLVINTYVSEADVIPNGMGITLESLRQVHTASELEPTGENLLETDYQYYADIQFLDPAGQLKRSFDLPVKVVDGQGKIEVDNRTMAYLLPELGPGLSTIKLQIQESPYYKASPLITIPLEVRSENWIRFGEKNTKIDLIHPFINSWGEAYSGAVDWSYTTSVIKEESDGLNFEAGTVQLDNSIDGGFEYALTFDNTYSSPVVVAYLTSRNDAESVDVRVKDVSSTGCTLFMEEPDDGTHLAEEVVYIVMEKGKWTLPDDNVLIEAGTHTTSTYSDGSTTAYDTISFGQSFNATPVVLHTLNSYNNAEFMSSAVHSVSVNDFQLSQEAAETSHVAVSEQIGWIAIENNKVGTIDSIKYETGSGNDGTNDGCDDAPHVISYTQSYSSAPLVVVKQISRNGANGGWTRAAGTSTSTSHEVYCEEDTISDSERAHIDENFNFFAIENSITLGNEEVITGTETDITYGESTLKDYMPFESNYPHIIGTLWVDPSFNATGSELSIQDYIEIGLGCTVYNDDGTISEFPLRENLMLRPGNREGFMAFDVGLGPEDAFLLGLDCKLNLTFNIYDSIYSIYEDERDVHIYLLDLQVVENPSSLNPNEIYKLSRDEFSAPSFPLEIDETITETKNETLTLGGIIGDTEYGLDYEFTFDPEQSSYIIEEEFLLEMPKLVSITSLAVKGLKNGTEYEFISNTDWEIGSETSEIRFLGNDLPDNYTEFSVIYELTYDYGSEYYGEITLGYSNHMNETTIDFDFTNNFLPSSEESHKPMFIMLQDTFTGDGLTNVFTLEQYSAEGLTTNDFIIYNKDQLESLGFGSITESEYNGFPAISFGTDVANGTEFTVFYGLKSQYEIGYGFQTIDRPLSDSIRLVYNNYENPNRLVDYNQDVLLSSTLDDPSLYIGLGGSEKILDFYDLPLMYAPEINMEFILDEFLIDWVRTAKGQNNISQPFMIEVFVSNDDSLGTYYDSEVISLDYEEIIACMENGKYTFKFKKDLQSIFDMYGTSSIDLTITVSQNTNTTFPMPYILLSNFTYLCDEHLVEMYDRMPRNAERMLDVKSVVSTNHYYQIFSLPLRDSPEFEYLPDSPFDLLEGSKVTVALKDLPYSSLVRLNVSSADDYAFNYLGSQETLTVSDDYFNMIASLGLFTGGYNIQNEIYQDGYLDLYYGSGTETDGERQYEKEFEMTYEFGEVPDYTSFVSDGDPISWEDTYELTDQFLSTNEIDVWGTVYYHQLFDLDTDSINQTEILELFGQDYYEEEFNVEFGVKLPEDISMCHISSIGTPYQYELSVQGFPIGDYPFEYCTIPSEEGSEYLPSENILDYFSYRHEYLENGSEYILFNTTSSEIASQYGDAQNKIMVDYHCYQTFTEGFDYEIIEDPEDPYISLLQWNYEITDINSFTLHPDFSQSSSFTVTYSALEWDYMDENYVEECTDEFTYQPKVNTEVYVGYEEGEVMEYFDILNVIPDNQVDRDAHEIFPLINVPIWDGENETTLMDWNITNHFDDTYIVKEENGSYWFTMNFTEIISTIPNDYVIKSGSSIVLPTVYNSTKTSYMLSCTPFNYDYLKEGKEGYHITLTIGGTTFYSYESEFNNFIAKIENNYIYFTNKNSTQAGYIEPGTEIKVEYKNKLQPGLLDRKHFLMIIHPWTNAFDTLVNEELFGATSDPNNNFRERFRKLSGSSIISPFEYSLSINDMYSLYLSYRLNQKQYFDEKFVYDYNSPEYTYDYMPHGVDDFVDELEDSEGTPAVNVFYFDEDGMYQFLDESCYSVNPTDHTITLIRQQHYIDGFGMVDDNPITSTENDITEFYVSFVPKPNDITFENYRFSYNPKDDEISESLVIDSWEVLGGEGDLSELHLIPNLDVAYHMNESESTSDEYVCYATQLNAYLETGNELEFNIANELPQSLVNNIHSGNYLSLYLQTNIDNFEVLKGFDISFDEGSGYYFSEFISIEDLAMYDFDIKITLPSGANSLQKIKLTPIFTNDGQYSSSNNIGITRFEFFMWDEMMTYVDENGETFMKVELEHPIIENPDPSTSMEVAYLFNDQLDYLAIGENYSFKIEEVEDQFGKVASYILHIPSKYVNPENSDELLSFTEGDFFALRYHSPIEQAISMSIGKTYLHEKPYGYDTRPLPMAEITFINTTSIDNDYENYDYTEFNNPYSLKIPIELTPFDTQYMGTFKDVRLDINISTLGSHLINGTIDFSHIVISVPYPSYELTLTELEIVRSTRGDAGETELIERVWQYTEFETFTSDDDPFDDMYNLTMENTPLLYEYGDDTWLELLKIYDENYNYYSTALTGDQDQLLYNYTNGVFTWNEAFDRYQDYWGMQIHLPSMIDSNSSLYFAYCTEDSWKAPIVLNYANIDATQVDLYYEDMFYLTPRYEEWFGELYDNGANDSVDYDYEITQYYSESFTVFEETNTYTHTFDIGEYNFSQDFINISLSKIIGLYANFSYETIKDNDHYNLSLNLEKNSITIESLTSLNEFDLITVSVNFSIGPVSSYSTIQMTNYFNQTYLTDPEATFYDYLTISFPYEVIGTESLFSASSHDILTNYDLFESINYTRRFANFEAEGYDRTEIYEKFGLHSDPFNVIYTADLEMDGVADYKWLIDIDKDGEYDIKRYGIGNESAETSDGITDIIWHTTISEYKTSQDYAEIHDPESYYTQWFDIDDRILSDFSINSSEGILDIVADVLFGDGLLNVIGEFFLPPMDYWAKRSISQSVDRDITEEQEYYSISLDYDKDGNTDKSLTFQSVTSTANYKVSKNETTILAAKPQNFWSLMVRNIAEVFVGLQDDPIFNEELTQEMIESTINGGYGLYQYSPEIRDAIISSYRKYTKYTTYYDSETNTEEVIIVSDFENGTAAEVSYYTDSFNDEIVDSEEKTISIINNENGLQKNIPVHPQITYSDPNEEESKWDKKLWDDGNEIPISLDSKMIVTEGGVQQENYFEKTITLCIPHRYSAYHDYKKIYNPIGDDYFTVQGIFITPEDGVYYTSEKEGDAWKSRMEGGHYFYFDADEDNFYETVYILYPQNDDGSYEVKSIGYNYDGRHDFKPYEEINYDDTEIINNEFNILKDTETQFSRRLYSFSKLSQVELLFPNTKQDNLRAKDHIFEISKLVDRSTENKKFSQLFYDVRHDTFDEAWERFGGQVQRDINEQVISTLVASTVSCAIMTSSLGIATPLAHAAYFGVYAFFSKYFMDVKIREAKAVSRANTFIPEGADNSKPTSLNQKNGWDHLLGNSMPAALAGHPGAYYTEVIGGEMGDQYKAYVIASPENWGRLVSASFSTLSSLAFAVEGGIDNINILPDAPLPEKNPDTLTALDFDHHNLDFMLATNELYALNNEDGYAYVEDENLLSSVIDESPKKVYSPTMGSYSYLSGPDFVEWILKETTPRYRFRTHSLGYVEQAISKESKGKYDSIKPICINGKPQYIFVNSKNDVLPKSVLYQPLVVSEERFESLSERDKYGYLVVESALDSSIASLNEKGDIEFETSNNDFRTLSMLENSFYKAGISLAKGTFTYPIKSVTAYVIADGSPVHKKELSLTEIDISEETGTLYFKKQPFDIIFEGGSTQFKNVIGGAQTVKYKFVVKIQKIIPETSTDKSATVRNALAQSTSYAIMDYFDQYEYARQTALSIAEIGYTEVLTLRSTIITSPAIVLGHYLAEGVKKALLETSAKVTFTKAATNMIKTALARGMWYKTIGKLAGQIAFRTVVGSVYETVEEIVVDGAVEPFFQNLVTGVGGSENAAHWVSTFMTTARETKFFTSLGGDTNTYVDTSLTWDAQVLQANKMNSEFKGWYSQKLFMFELGNYRGLDFNTQNKQEIQTMMDQLGMIKHQQARQRVSLRKFMLSGSMALIGMLVPSIGGFNLFTLSPLFKNFKKGALNQYMDFVEKRQVRQLAEKLSMNRLGVKPSDLTSSKLQEDFKGKTQNIQTTPAMKSQALLGITQHPITVIENVRSKMQFLDSEASQLLQPIPELVIGEELSEISQREQVLAEMKEEIDKINDKKNVIRDLEKTTTLLKDLEDKSNESPERIPIHISNVPSSSDHIAFKFRHIGSTESSQLLHVQKSWTLRQVNQWLKRKLDLSDSHSYCVLIKDGKALYNEELDQLGENIDQDTAIGDILSSNEVENVLMMTTQAASGEDIDNIIEGFEGYKVIQPILNTMFTGIDLNDPNIIAAMDLVYEEYVEPYEKFFTKTRAELLDPKNAMKSLKSFFAHNMKMQFEFILEKRGETATERQEKIVEEMIERVFEEKFQDKFENTLNHADKGSSYVEGILLKCTRYIILTSFFEKIAGGNMKDLKGITNVELVNKIGRYLGKNDFDYDLEKRDILHNKIGLFLFKFAESFNTGARQATMRLSDHSGFQLGWEFETLTMLYIQPHFLLEDLIDNNYDLEEFTFFDTFMFNPKKEILGISSHDLDSFLEGKSLDRLIEKLYGGIDIFFEDGEKANYRITDVIAYFIENSGFFFTECKASQDSLNVYLEDVIIDLFSNIYPAIYRALAKENIHVEDAFNKMVVSIKEKDRGALWRFMKKITKISKLSNLRASSLSASRGVTKEKGSYKGSKHFAFYSEVAEMINEKLAKLETIEFKNNEDEVDHIKLQIQNMFNDRKFIDHVRGKARKIFEVEWSDDTWLENAQTFFTSNLIEMPYSDILKSSFLRKDANGDYKLHVDATFNAHAITDESLTIDKLKNIPFFVIKDKISGLYNSITYEQLRNEVNSKSGKYDLKGSFTTVHRSVDGAVENGLLLLYNDEKNGDAQIDLEKIKTEEPIHIGFKGVKKNKDGTFEEEIIEGVFINRYDKESEENKLLVGAVRLNPKTLQLERVEQKTISWLLYNALNEESVDFYGVEDINSYFTLEHVRSNCHQVGSKVSFVLQNVHTKIVPTGSYNRLITGLGSEKYFKKLVDDIKKAEGEVGSQTEIDLRIASNLIGQLAQRTSSEELVVFDDVFRISSKGFQIFPKDDLIEYSREHFKNVLAQMSPSDSELDKITHYKLTNRETGGITWNDIDVKSFFMTWLDMIKKSIAYAEDPENEGDIIHYFSEFTHLKTCEFSEEGIDKNDINIIEKVRDALIEVFGYEFFTLLINGVMTITVSSSGDYGFYFKNHNTQDLEDRLEKFGLLPVKDRLKIRFLTGGGREHYNIGSYAGPITHWTASLLVGSRLGLIHETEKLYITPPTPLLYKLFENTHNVFDDKKLGIDEIIDYNRILLKKFYNHYFRDLVPPDSYVGNEHLNEQLFFEGAQILVKIMKEAFENSKIEKDLIKKYTELEPKEDQVKEVAISYMLRQFIRGLYTSWSKKYREQLIKALIQGEGFITIGYNPTSKTINPIFAINEEIGYEGYKIQIPIEKFTNEVKSKIIWALTVSNSQLSRLKDNKKFSLIVKHEIENPIKHIYKELYNALEKYNHEGFYVTSEGLENRGTFEVYFYTPGPSGFVKANKKITLDSSDPSYKTKLASVVSLMVKKMYTIVIKQKYKRGQAGINVLYADQFGILDEDYIKTNFYSTQISGTLQNDYYEKYYEDNEDDEDRAQWEDSRPYENLEESYKEGAFNLENSFPLDLFAETEEFSYNKMIAEIFSSAALTDPIYPTIKPEKLP